MRICLALLLCACAAEETALPPLVAVPDEPQQQSRDPLEPPPVAERDVNRCDQVGQLKQQGFEAMTQKRYDEAKKHYLRAIELDPADRDPPAQIARIDKLTENASGSDNAIAHAQSMGAARSPCDQPKVADKTPPPPKTEPVPQPPSETPKVAPVAAEPQRPEVRQDGTVTITAKDQHASKHLPTAAEVQKVLSKEDARIVACYTAALGRDASLAGKATYALTADKDGKVSELRTSESSLYDSAMDSCIQAALKRFVLAKKVGGQIEIYYALIFSPRTLPKASDQRSLLRQ